MGAGCLTLARSLTLTLPSRERSQPYGSRRNQQEYRAGGGGGSIGARAAGKRLLGGGAQSAVSECPPHPGPAPAPAQHTPTA